MSTGEQTAVLGNLSRRGGNYQTWSLVARPGARGKGHLGKLDSLVHVWQGPKKTVQAWRSS